MASQQVVSLFQDFGKHIGIGDLALDELGYCCLFFDDVGVNIEVDEASSRLFLYSRIGDLPPRGERLALYELLLDGNSFFQGTDGGTLGVDTENGIAVLVWPLPIAGLGFRELEQALERFVEITRIWQERYRETVERRVASTEDTSGFTEGIRG